MSNTKSRCLRLRGDRWWAFRTHSGSQSASVSGSILLVEARDRIGGRMHGRRLASGQWIDFGGQWVGPTPGRILALLDEYGVRRFPSPAHGRTVLLFNGDDHEFHALFTGFHECEVPGVTAAEWRGVTEPWERFHALSRALPTGQPVAGDEKPPT
jgi:L-amino acid dehydrogenase